MHNAEVARHKGSRRTTWKPLGHQLSQQQPCVCRVACCKTAFDAPLRKVSGVITAAAAHAASTPSTSIDCGEPFRALVCPALLVQIGPPPRDRTTTTTITPGDTKQALRPTTAPHPPIDAPVWNR